MSSVQGNPDSLHHHDYNIGINDEGDLTFKIKKNDNSVNEKVFKVSIKKSNGEVVDINLKNPADENDPLTPEVLKSMAKILTDEVDLEYDIKGNKHVEKVRLDNNSYDITYKTKLDEITEQFPKHHAAAIQGTNIDRIVLLNSSVSGRIFLIEKAEPRLETPPSSKHED